MLVAQQFFINRLNLVYQYTEKGDSVYFTWHNVILFKDIVSPKNYSTIVNHQLVVFSEQRLLTIYGGYGKILIYLPNRNNCLCVLVVRLTPKIFSPIFVTGSEFNAHHLDNTSKCNKSQEE